MKIDQLLNQLDAYSQPVPLDQLKHLLEQLEFEASDIQALLQFNDATYQRNLVKRCDNYEALILCFKAGQRTPVHDHAGSACGVKILQGTGTETIFDSTIDGWLFATNSRELLAGGVVGSNDTDTHQLSNLQTHGRTLVTLHVYSPPLGRVGNYSIEDNSVHYVTAASRDLRSSS